MSSSIEKLYKTLMDAGLSEEEIQKQVKEKVKEYQGFISEKGILFIIAKELGVNMRSPDIDSVIYNEIEEEIDYNEFSIKISEVSMDMSNIVILGRIEKIFKIRNFFRN